MDILLRQNYIKRVIIDLQAISGADWERLGYVIASRLARPTKLWHRGTNENGAPVGYTVDSFSADGSWIAEYTTLSTFFSNPKKSKGDIKHALKQHSGKPKVLYLISNQECGEKRLDVVKRRERRMKNWVQVDTTIMDARAVAEYIVDDLLLDDEAVELMSVFLSSVRQFHSEAAFSLLMSPPDEQYVARPELESQLLNNLKLERLLTIYGVSGSGKTELARAIAWSARREYQLVLWIDARGIDRLESLSAIDVRRNGHSVNVAGLLRERKCLIVLDDLPIDVGEHFMASITTSDSAVLVTRQLQLSGRDKKIDDLPENAATSILNFGLETPCPDDLKARLYNKVGGYPLAYRLINANVRYFSCSWADVESDVAAINQYQDNTGKHLTERLIGKLAAAIPEQLAFIKFCKKRAIDREFAKGVLRPIGVLNLQKWGVAAQAEPLLLVVHDAVFEILAATDLAAHDFDGASRNTLRHRLDSDWQGFVRISTRHAGLWHERWTATRGYLYLYAFLIGSEELKVEDSVLEELLSPATIAALFGSPDAELGARAVLEAIEMRYRKSKISKGVEAAKAELKAHLPLFDELRKLANQMSGEIVVSMEHHLAKSLLITGDEQKAKEIFQRLSGGVSPYPEAQLQLARIYSGSGNGAEHDLAAPIVKSLLVDGIAGRVSHSVTLAALQLYRRKVVRERLPQLIEGNEEQLMQLVLQVAAFRPAQAIEAFMALASNWSYHEPERFLTVFGALPPPQLDGKTKDPEVFAWAEILGKASSAYESTRKDSEPGMSENLRHEALRLMNSLKSPTAYQERSKAELLFRMGRNSDALEILEGLEKRNALDPWGFYWKAKNLYQLKRYEAALESVERALQADMEEKYRVRFEKLKMETELVLMGILREGNADPHKSRN